MKRGEAGSRSRRGASKRRLAAALSLGLVAVAVVVYLGAALIGVPVAVERALAGIERSGPSRQARVERIRVNPFTLTIDLFDLELSAPAAQVSLAHLRSRLDPASLLERRWVLDELVLERPQLRLAAAELGGLANLYAAPAEPAAGPAARLRISRVALTDGRFELAKAPGSAVGPLVLERVAATASGIDVERNRGRYRGSIGRALGGTLSFEGELAPRDLAAHGRVGGRGLDLAALGPWLEPGLAALPPSGRADVTGEYELSAHPRIELAGRVEPDGAAFAVARDWEAGREALELSVEDAPAETLAPYARAALGRGLAAGRIDLAIDFARTGERGTGSLDIRAVGLAFAPPARGRPIGRAALADSGEPPALPLALAAALLEDANGEIGLGVPFASSAGAAAAGTRDALLAAAAAALRVRIFDLARDPFVTLASLVGRDGGGWARVAFAPGTPALSDTAADSLAGLAAALRQRPLAGLAVSAGYDPAADRDALALQQIELHVLLATAGAAPRARAAAVDFGSPRVQDVLDEFAGERLGSGRLEALAARFGFDADAPPTSPARVAYYRAIFDALVANETIEPSALERLGRFRAQAIVGALARNGVAADRIAVARDDLVLGGDGRVVEASLALEPRGRFAASAAGSGGAAD